MTVLGILATALSFMGLCGLIRRGLRLEDGFCAPLVGACVVMLALMAGGLAGVLRWMWAALFTAGLAGFVWIYLARRRGVDWTALLVTLLGAAYVLWRFPGSYFTGNDSASHWGLAAKFFLRENRFPGAEDAVIGFPSYPLDATCFLYYACRLTGYTPGGCLAAQTLLAWMSLLPLAGMARRNRAVGLALGLMGMVWLMALNRFPYSLQVDALMACMALGATCALARLRKRPRAAMAIAGCVMAALLFVKSAGLFFSLLLAGLAAALPVASNRRVRARRLIGCLALIAALFGLWQLHVRLAFGGSAGLHAVSLSDFTQSAAGKDRALILRVARSMIARLFRPGARLFPLALLAAALGLILLLKEDRGLWLRRLRRCALFTLGVCAAWYAALFAVYIFSMLPQEAEGLASVDRYESTAVIYAIGIALMFILARLGETDLRLSRVRAASVIGIMTAAGVVLALVPIGRVSYAATLFDRSLDGHEAFDYMIRMRDKYDIAEGKRYLVVAKHQPEFPYRSMTLTKYEFMSTDVRFIYFDLVYKGVPQEGYYLARFDGDGEVERIDDLAQTLAEEIERYDYLLVYDEDPEVDAVIRAFCETYDGRAAICFGY